MASLLQKGNRYSLQFRLRPNTDRITISLGDVAESQAQNIQSRVEELVKAIKADRAPDVSTTKWCHKLDDDLHAKLVKAGLLVPRDGAQEGPQVPALSKFVDDYITKRTDVKPGTAAWYRRAKGQLVGFFGATRPLDRITAEETEDFRRWLTSDRKQGSNTTAKLCCVAKQFFRAAVRRKLIAENPFVDMKHLTVQPNRERDYFVTLTEAAAVLEACPDAEWRLIFALARFGGLRCTSEHMRLRWIDIDWERNRFTVHSPKTEHHQGGGIRVVPIFPELRPYLEEAFEQAEEGAEFVVSRYRWAGCNLRTAFERIVLNAGLTPWPKLFQNLRATRATELVAAGWPEYKVCKWLGHTEAVAKKHYWQVTDDDYAAAAGVDGKALQKSLQVSDATPCFPMRDKKNHHRAKPAISRENTGIPDAASNSLPVSGVLKRQVENLPYWPQARREY